MTSGGHLKGEEESWGWRHGAEHTGVSKTLFAETSKSPYRIPLIRSLEPASQPRERRAELR